MSKGMGELLTYTNLVSEGWISNMFLIGIYILILIGFYKAKDDFTGAMAVAGYGTFVVALLFWVGGFVTGWALDISIALAIIGTLFLLLDNN
jgi:hypothetical protein